MNEEEIKIKFNESANLISQTGEKEARKIIEISKEIIKTYKGNGKVLIVGNGGSAADAQHISAELVNMFYKKRKALSAIALTTDTSVLTSWANDVAYDKIFERQVEAHGKTGDILLSLTTSGNSENILLAIKKAKSIGMKTISLLGNGGGKAKNLSDYEIIISQDNVARIQEAHHVVYHMICELVEKEFSEGN